MATLIVVCRPDAADMARAIAARHPDAAVRVTSADLRTLGEPEPRIPGGPEAQDPAAILLVQTAPWPIGIDAAWADTLVATAGSGAMGVAQAGAAGPGRFAEHVRAWIGATADDDAPDAAGDRRALRLHRAFSRRGAMDAWRRQLAAQRPLAFAIDCAAWTAAGGLDQRNNGVALVEDLAARVVADGRTVASVGVAAAGPDHDADPHGPMKDAGAAAFLLVEARLRTMMRALPPDTRGRAVSEALCEAIGEAWRASAVDTARLAFGGAWGKRPLLRASRVAAARASGLWPADEVGTLMPLLAIDAVADAIVTGTIWTARGDSMTDPRIPGSLDPPSSSAPSPSEARGDSMADPRIPGSPDPPSLSLSLPVSVIIVSWNGLEHLEPCLASLEASTLARDRFEIVLVDNGSRDGSVEFVRQRFPAVRIAALEQNEGFTGGNCAGVEASRGDVLVFLNNDMRVEPTFLERLVGSLDQEHPCVAARVLSWDGRRVDFISGTMNFEGRGYQPLYGERPDRAEGPASTFFPNGGAFAITRDAYERAGGFDRALFAYYDDIDLGWGVRASGGEVAIAEGAIAYHRHGATSRRQPAGQKQFLLERNSLVTTLKRYEPATLDAVLPVMLFLRVRRILDGASLDARHPHARWLAGRSRRVGAATARSAEALAKAEADSRRGGAPGLLRDFATERWAALGAALGMLPHVASERARLAAARRVGDPDLVAAFGATFEVASPGEPWRLAQETLLRVFGADRALRRRMRVLIVTHEPLRARMSGPGIRALELARVLAPSASVTLATPYPPELDEPSMTLCQYDPRRQASLRKVADRCDVFVVQGFTLAQFPFLADAGALAVDLYCPFTVEHLEMHASRLATGEEASRPVVAEAASLLGIQAQQLAAGDFFLCASERQRDFWLGALHTAGRVNPETYTADPTLRRLIDVVPFGVADEPPETQMARRGLVPAIRGRLPGVPHDAFVLLWGGSILDWQDPETLITAVAQVASTHPHVRLVFMGTKHPNPQVAPMRVVERSRALAASLGLEGRHVIFNDWVDYDARAAWLTDADVGVSTHGDHLETRLSFRTRMLDYLWAGLPIVCSEGDWFAELVTRERLGLVVPAGDVEALAAALRRLMDDAALRSESALRAREVGQAMRWSAVTRPLVDFVAAARPAADRARMARERKRLAAGGYGIVKRMKRAARAVGMSETTIERLKDTSPGRALMLWQHRRAHDRAKRQAGAKGAS